MNHPEWIEWVIEVPFVLFINFEHDINLKNASAELVRLGISVGCDCIMNEDIQICD